MAEPITQVLGIVGIKNRGEYNPETTYEKLNTVRYQGQTYCAKTDTQGNLPTNTDYWDLMVEKGEKGDMPVKGVDYYTSEDKEELITELEGTLDTDVTSEVSDQLSDLTSATPLVASSISGMTDTTRIYVNTTNGHWYWYNGSAWTDGGVYQATSDHEDVEEIKDILDSMDVNQEETFLKGEKIVQGSIQVQYVPLIIVKQYTEAIGCNQFIPVVPGEKVEVVIDDIEKPSGSYFKYRFGWYDIDNNYISQNSMTTNPVLTIPNNAYYFSYGVYLYDENDTVITSPALYDLISDTSVKIKFHDRYKSLDDLMRTDEFDDFAQRYLDNNGKLLDRNIYIKGEKIVQGSIQALTNPILFDKTVKNAIGCNELIPVVPGEKVEVVIDDIEKPSGSYFKYRFGWYDTNGTSISQIISTTDPVLTIPNNAYYFCYGAYLYDENDTAITSPELYDLISDTSVRIKFHNRYEALTELMRIDEFDDFAQNFLDKYLEEHDKSGNIVYLNEKIKDVLIQAKRTINVGASFAYQTNIQPVVLLHFSDIHGDSLELSRMVEFRKEYNNMIDDAICTGDLIPTRFSDDFSYWGTVEGAEKILLAIGNHDALADETGWDWNNRATQQQQYDKYFSSYIRNWNCNYQSGKTYYYKDYQAKKLRLIVLNVMLQTEDNSEQLSWLQNTLADAIAKDYSVVIANHYMIADSEKINCNFSSIDKGIIRSEVLPLNYLAAVQTFINNGGKFVCHIAGHTHYDLITRSTTFPNQLCVIVDALNRLQGNQYSDTQRTDGIKSQDLANLFVIDTESKVIKVIRVGADQDHYLRDKKYISINYDTQEILSQE